MKIILNFNYGEFAVIKSLNVIVLNKNIKQRSEI